MIGFGLAIGWIGVTGFALAAVPLKHLFGLVDQALGFGDAVTQPDLASLYFGSVPIAPFRPLFGRSHRGETPPT